jgi:four helix bundle protein
MAIVTRYEDLEIWKISREIVDDILRDFKNLKDSEFKDQVYSTGFSIMNHIAEGFGRESKKEFHRFLDVAKSSCSKVKNMYYIAEDLKYIDSKLAQTRREKCDLEKNSIAKFMKYLKTNSLTKTKPYSKTA